MRIFCDPANAETIDKLRARLVSLDEIQEIVRKRDRGGAGTAYSAMTDISLVLDHLKKSEG